MLSRENRLVSADDFRLTMRSGSKLGGSHMVIYIKRVESSTQTRFGFVVAKPVGGAVKRNLVKRRMRAIARELTPTISEPVNIVVRALPGAAEMSWQDLRDELLQLMSSIKVKAGVA